MHSKRIREKIKADYNAIAKEFDQTRQFPWKEFSAFLPFYKPDSNVLDLGCGNGRLFAFLKKQGFQSYLGVDQSEELLKCAKKAHPEAKFLLADIADLPEMKSFDAIFAIASFHHLPPTEQGKALRAWKKLLKPGGRLFMTNWNLYQLRFFPLWVKTLLFPRYGLTALQIPWKKQIQRVYFALRLKALSRLLEKNGFKILHEEKGQNLIHIVEA